MRSYFRNKLDKLREQGALRRIPVSPLSEGILDLSLNDYLGLAARREKLWEEFISTRNKIPSLTSSASRLLASDQEEYISLEHKLGSLYNRECLLFNSGYHLNTGLISSLGSIPSTLLVADRLSHASIIDGAILSRAPLVRFRHNDMAHLRRIIETKAQEFRHVVIITESIFSMDGDEAPIQDIVNLKKLHPDASIYLDEAHAFGARGKLGLGISEEKGIIPDIDFLCATFGKAAASAGAFAIISPEAKEYFINHARSLIFSTAIPPLQAAWTSFMIDKITSGNDLRIHLHEISLRLRNALETICGRDSGSSSHIIPWIIGDNNEALRISSCLYEKGIRALPIRKPTVPEGTERIRFSLGANLSSTDIDRLVDVIRDINR